MAVEPPPRHQRLSACICKMANLRSTATHMAKTASSPPLLKKAPTGITGLDEITNGGVPEGRPTLVCGSAGCGKSLLAIEFLIRGAIQYNEPGVLMTFEEGVEDIKKNVASLGFDVDDLIAKKKLIIDHVHVERSQIEENGEYDLGGLFIRLGYAIDQIKAKRVVLDTIETLFSGLSNQAILRSELRRLFGWLERARHDHHHHRRAWRGPAHAAGIGGVCL